MNRRSFFKFLPIAPVALVAEGARAATSDEAPLDDGVKLVLHASKKSDGTCLNLHAGGSLSSRMMTDFTTSVTMSAGNDGHLWIKSKDGVWKRVVTE